MGASSSVYKCDEDEDNIYVDEVKHGKVLI